jgi:hypothetical protein
MKTTLQLKLCRNKLHWYSTDKRQCPECLKASTLKWKRANPESGRESAKKWRQANPEKAKEREKKWKKANPQRVQEYKRKWYRDNLEHKQKLGKKWKSANAGKVIASTARRRAAKKNALASWANLEAIKKIYEEAQYLTKTTGIKYVVDHIYPLQSKYMCGLHVENNLQILTEEENCKKGNRMWPGQLDCQKRLNECSHETT